MSERFISLRYLPVLMIVAVTILAVSVGILWGKEQGVEGKVQGVKVAGPCRALGVRAPECRRQAKLIVKSCLISPKCEKAIARFYSPPGIAHRAVDLLDLDPRFQKPPRRAP